MVSRRLQVFIASFCIGFRTIIALLVRASASARQFLFMICLSRMLYAAGCKKIVRNKIRGRLEKKEGRGSTMGRKQKCEWVGLA